VETDDRDIVAVMADAFDEPWDYEEAREEFQRSRTHDPSLWLVAFDDDRAVGALFSYITNGRGQVSALGVREPWRRRGIGQALLRAAFARLRERVLPTSARTSTATTSPMRLACTAGRGCGYDADGWWCRRSWSPATSSQPGESVPKSGRREDIGGQAR
jgi:GNAT superfamily N-acetyltransferase